MSERSVAESDLDQLAAALSNGDAGSFDALGRELEHQVLAPGAVLFRAGESADAMYVVVRGELVATIRDNDGSDLIIGRIRAGEPVGEMQIFSGGERTATVTAVSETAIVRISRATVQHLASERPDLMNRLADAVRRRIRHNQLVAILPTLFGPLDETMLDEIESTVRWVKLVRGSVLFKQGDFGQEAYIVVGGRLQVVVRAADGQETVVGEVQHGESVGEMSILTGEPRSATVSALRDSELVSLGRPAFERLIAKYPQTLMSLTRLVINRLRQAQSGSAVKSVVRVLAILAAGPDVPIREIASRLADALEPYGSTVCLNADEVDRLLATPGIARIPSTDPAAARISSLIDTEEVRHRFVILQADAEPSAWSKRCARHADRILVVGRAGDDPEPQPAEREILGDDPVTASVPTSLVLLHPRSTDLPQGTKRWLEHRRVLRHHHVRLHEKEDLERVARFVAGRAFGIALSGGGARGFAHIGVLRALAESEVPIDMIGGTSMGACIAAEHALGWDAETMARRNRDIFSGWKSDLTLPLVAILHGQRSTNRLRTTIGEIQIEDMWLPFFCVSSNLSRAEIVVHRDGPLWFGLRASAGLPGIFPPLVLGSDLLVDGGFLRNLPADIMRDMTSGGTTIAVDVSSELDMQYEHSHIDAISGWKILWNRLNPWAQKLTIPSIAAVIQRSGEIASVLMQREALLHGIDLYIRVPVQRFGLLEFEAARDIVATGYEAAVTALASWRQAPTLQPSAARMHHAKIAAASFEPEVTATALLADRSPRAGGETL